MHTAAEQKRLLITWLKLNIALRKAFGCPFDDLTYAVNILTGGYA